MNKECWLGAMSFCPSGSGKSRATGSLVEDGKVRLPFTSLKGVGESAAVALQRATINGQEYLSIEELEQATGVSGADGEPEKCGCSGRSAGYSQVSFF